LVHEQCRDKAAGHEKIKGEMMQNKMMAHGHGTTYRDKVVQTPQNKRARDSSRRQGDTPAGRAMSEDLQA
jgi:hypothetical protein